MRAGNGVWLWALLGVGLLQAGMPVVRAGGCPGQAGSTNACQASPAYVRFGRFEHKGDLLFSDQPLGSGAGLDIRLTEEELVPADSTHFGQWRHGLSSYVTTADEGDVVAPGASQVRLYEVGGGHQVYQMTGACAEGMSHCAYGADAVSGHQLVRIRASGQLPRDGVYRPTGSELGASRVDALLAGMSPEDRARAYVRTQGGDGYEVYGQIRGLPGGGHEAWLSHVVDRLGGVQTIHYDSGDGMLRIDYIEDAYGLRTRLFYADTEPLSSGEPLSGFADGQVPDALKQFWRMQLSGALPDAPRRLWKGLVVSAVDAYGNRARFDYVDGLSGLRLREMDRLGTLEADPSQLAGAIREVLEASLYPRLVRLEDAVGAVSQVEYACGNDGSAGSAGLVASVLELRSRQAGGDAGLLQRCLRRDGAHAVEAFGSGVAGTRWLFRRVKAIVTPYGRTVFHRVLRQVVRADGAAVGWFAGWVIEDPNQDLQRFEVLLGDSNEEVRSGIGSWIDRERAAGRSVKLRGRALPEYVQAGSSEGLRALYALVTGAGRDEGSAIAELKDEWSHRNSFFWDRKAMAELAGRYDRVQLMGAVLLPPDYARVTHYLHDQVPGQDQVTLSPLVMGRKEPLLGFKYFGYQGQSTQEHYRDAANGSGNQRVSQPALVLSDLETQYEGLVTQIQFAQYNAKGRLQRQWDSLGRGHQWEYAENNDIDVRRVYRLRTGTAMVEGGPLQVIDYNDRGQVERVVDAQGYERSYSYEPEWPYRVASATVPIEQGSLATGLSLVDSRYRTMRYQTVGPVFDRAQAERGPARTRMTVTRMDGHGQKVLEVYEDGLLTSVLNPHGMWRYEYTDDAGVVDGFGRLQRSYWNDVLQARYAYEGLNLGSVEDAQGNRASYGYDHLGRVVQTEVKDASGQLVGWTSVEYDLSGGMRLYRKLGGASGGYGYLAPQAMIDYDLLGRPVARTDADGLRSRAEYYPNSGMLREKQDPAGVANRYHYDRYGRLLTRQVVSPAEGLVRSVAMDYEPAYGRIRSVTDNGEVTRYSYQERGRLYGGVPGDPLRLLQSELPFTDAAGTAHRVQTDYLGYDGNGRLLGYRSNDDLGYGGPMMEIGLDAYGRIDRYDTEVSRTRVQYDAYDLASERYGNVRGLRYDLDGTAGTDELVQVADYYRRSDFGPVGSGTDVIPVGYDLHVGKSKGRSYHLGSRASTAALPEGPGSVFRTLEYDGNHRITKIDGYLDGQSRRFAYDGASRLVRSERYQGAMRLGGEGFAYDASGNRLGTRPIDAMGQELMDLRQQQTYGPSNRLWSYSERNAQGMLVPNQCVDPNKPDKNGLLHDGLGRLLVDPTDCRRRYYWDAEGHLVRVQYDERNWTQIYWNGMNQYTRIVEVVNGNPKDDKTFVWTQGGDVPTEIRDTPTGRLLLSFNGDGYQTYEYDAWGGSVQTRRYVMLRDHLGSVIGLVNEQGRQVAAIEYDEWGNTTRQQTWDDAGGRLVEVGFDRPQGYALPLQYAGYFTLKRAGLALTPNRAYHPRIGRWLSRDSIGEFGGDNLYAYVGNHPTMAIDPDGLNPLRRLDAENDLSPRMAPEPELAQMVRDAYQNYAVGYNNRAMVANSPGAACPDLYRTLIAEYRDYEAFLHTATRASQLQNIQDRMAASTGALSNRDARLHAFGVRAEAGSVAASAHSDMVISLSEEIDGRCGGQTHNATNSEDVARQFSAYLHLNDMRQAIDPGLAALGGPYAVFPDGPRVPAYVPGTSNTGNIAGMSVVSTVGVAPFLGAAADAVGGAVMELVVLFLVWR